MTRRALVALAAIAVAAGALGAALFARGSGSEGAEGKPAGACRHWIAARAYAKEIAAVRPLVLRMKRAFGAPGVGVAVAADGRLVWSETCGFADRERRVDVRRTTQFRIGSVSKTLTAVTVARLYQRGRLDLDAEVQRYVPDFPRKSSRITARRLGGHLAGIRHYEGAEALSTERYDSIGSSLSVFEDDPLVGKPGERFSYSSYGFNLLGAVVEGAAGKPFAAAVRQAVLTPLRMTRTRLDNRASGSGRARFYEVTSSRKAVPAPRVDLSNRFPSGGFLSTAEDLARFGIGITDRTFIKADTQSLLFTSQKTSSGEPTGYGFGFEVGESPFGRVAGHTGNVIGGTAFLFVHPRTRVAVAMTTNIGFVTAANPPALGRGVPDPPRLALPFIRRALRTRG
jgi:serine beta-lactamase-like protein LACTB, mitochondrial